MQTLLRDLVFVYGSLRRGQANHHLLRGSAFVGMHRTEPRYTMYVVGAYPGVVGQGQHAIVGEIYRISTATLAHLDALEDYPLSYGRARIVTEAGRAWIYLYRRAGGHEPIVEGGDWCRYTFGVASIPSNNRYQS